MNKSELKQMIREELQTLMEGSDKHVYVEKYGSYITLWSSYASGSGTTTLIKKWNTFYTDKSGDSHYDDIVRHIVGWSKNNKPVVKGTNGNVYKIPFYDSITYSDQHNTRQLSIWGGNIKPKGYVWLTVQKFGEGSKHNIVSLFKNKNEATAWVKF